MNELKDTEDESSEIKKITETKSDLISVTAHQLRTSLSALKWTLKMLLDGDFGEVNDKQKEYIDKAISSNERALTLVNYLLAFNHSDNSSMIVKFSMISMVDILEKIIPIFDGELKNKGIILEFSRSDKDFPKVKCDEEMITDVFQNLIENAIKYSFDNSKIKIVLDYNSQNNEIIVSIHDDGIGIKKEDQVKIFNKFFRSPNAIEKENIGSGLGLYTSKNIIEKHNGKIWFESGEGTGTTFFVVLPAN